MKNYAKHASVNDLFYLINCTPPRTHVDTSLDQISERICISSHNKIYLEDDAGKLCGVIQARQLALKILQLSPAESAFEDLVPLMVFQLNAHSSAELAITPPSVNLSDTLETTLTIMGNQDVREIAVVDDNQHLVGVLEAKTILAYYLNKKAHISE
jgi:CBS domain containing-hemolysin-like protein